MKWGGLQVNRARFLHAYDSLPIVLFRYLLLGLGLVGLLVLTLSWLFPVTTAAVGLGLLFVSPAIAVGSFDLYVRYLRMNPGYQIGKTSYPLDRADFDLALLLTRFKSSPTLQTLWQGLFEIPATQEAAYRLGLLPQQESEFARSDSLTEHDQELLLQTILGTGGKIVTPFSLLWALTQLPITQKFLEQQKVSPKLAQQVINYYEQRLAAIHLAPHHLKTGGFAKDWSVSYTNLLDVFAAPLPDFGPGWAIISPLFSRDSLVEELANELTKTSNTNLLLVGQEGSGRRQLFLHLAAQMQHYQTKTELDGQEVRLLNIQHLLSVGGTVENLQRLLDRLFSEVVRAGNIVLFIDQISLLLSPSATAGTADLTNLLSGYLVNPKIKIVGTITNEDYVEIIKPNSLLSQSFSVIEVPVPTKEDTLLILLTQLLPVEQRYQVFFPIEVLQAVVELADRYLKNGVAPQRELDLLEQVASYVHGQSQHLVTEEQVVTVVERRAKVQIRVNAQQQSSLLNLQPLLHQQVIGQDWAIKQVADALLRARAGFTGGDKPIGTFLFLGPTGVGKTETAKALANIYFGSMGNLIRLDMSEYADDQALEKLLGRDAVKQPGALTIAIQETPSAVVLLDELEKANSMLRNVLLQLLDEGRLTTNYGKLLDFTNTIIIATSNAGSDFIRDQVTKGIEAKAFEKQLVDRLITQKTYLPEFLNRFDGVIVFSPLKPAEVEQIVRLQLTKIAAQLKLDKGITVTFSDAVIEQLAKRGYDPVFGARALERVIKNDLETAMAKQIIAQQLTAGSKLEVTSL